MFVLASIQKKNAKRVSLAAFSYLAADVFIAVNTKSIVDEFQKRNLSLICPVKTSALIGKNYFPN